MTFTGLYFNKLKKKGFTKIIYYLNPFLEKKLCFNNIFTVLPFKLFS